MKKILLLPVFLITLLWSSFLQQGFAQTVIDFNNPPSIGAVKSIPYEGFTFAATIANPSFNIGFDNVGVGGSFALIDGNNDQNGLTRWTITRDGGIEFQFQKIWIFNRDPGTFNTSTSGTIQGFKNGNPVGPAKPILFNGESVFSADPDFFDVDEIRIEAPDIYVAIDDFTYGPVFVPVDSDPAEVTSISLSGAPLSNVSSVAFTVNFSKTALNVSVDDFQLTSTGTAAGTITSVAGSGTSYTVTVNGITGEGSLRLDLKSGTNITNERGDDGTAPFTSGQVHFVSPCLVETFEGETIGSKTFAAGSNSFTITGNLEVYRGPTLNIGIGGSSNVLKNTGTGSYTITSGSGAILMNSAAFFLSSDPNGATPTGTGTLTLVGKRGGNTVYTITKNSGFNTSFSTNSGYTIVNFGTEGGVNNATKPIDQLEINIGGGFVYLNVDNFQFCTDTEAPSGYTATIDQDLINTANQNSVSFTLAGAEVGSSYNYTFSSSGGGTYVTGSGTVVSSTQQVSGINLTGLPDGTITLSVTLTDPSSNTGTAATDTSIKLLNNVPIALPPTNTSAFEDAFLDLNGMAVTDPDGDNQLVSFTITGGILTIGTQNISFGGNGNGSSSFTASGTLSDINTALAQARFRPTSNLFGIDAATIRFTSNDGFSISEEASTTFDIEAVNDPPLLIIPGFQVTDEDTPLVFSSANSNQIQIEDIDAGTGPMNLEISATNGTFTLATIQNISFAPGRGDGTDDPRMDFSGTLAAINSAISTLTFTPAANFSGEATLELIISDLGSTGLGGTLTDMETIRIVVTAQNDAPTVQNSIPHQNATEDVEFVFQFDSDVFFDADGDELSYSAQLAGGGTLPTWLTFNPANRTFSGTPANSEVGTITIAVTADDGNGGTETDTFDITVLNTNDAPTVANPIPDQFATENSAFNFQFGLNVFNDIDVGDELSYTAQLAGGGSLPTWLSFDGLNRRFPVTSALAHLAN
ncbi:putative Ig domain-containing protein, partial [Algoriphagus sp. AK58]|uniref:putative Ig domain-containing protein n=1 Tax=Algoriphagus sp. AK58 TaxID=1406877 RepID=UPI0016506AD0